MHPELLRIPGGPTIYSYGICMMVGAATATWWMMRRAKRAQVDPAVMLNIALLSVVFGVIGARIFYLVHYWPRFADSPSPLKAALDVRNGGMEFLGGFILVVLVVAFYLRVTRRPSSDGKSLERHPVLLYLDIATPPFMLALSVARIGCFLNGCCFGGMCTVSQAGVARLPWAVQFPFGSFALVDQWERRQVALPAELLGASQGRLVPAPLNRFTLAHATGRRGSRVLARQLAFPSRIHPGRAATLAEIKAVAAASVSRPVHPTQLYSSINAFLLAMLLAGIYRVRRHHGTVFAALLMLYAPSRFLLERIRTDNPADTMGLTVSQFTSLALFAVGAAILLHIRYRSSRGQGER